ncbi:hypothetical protein Ct61P_15093 [Colletotrichum tofieldiae]|nr:hypothetical protein Ct61P_15093 [Colletotrichum tofieldiae]
MRTLLELQLPKTLTQPWAGAKRCCNLGGNVYDTPGLDKIQRLDDTEGDTEDNSDGEVELEVIRELLASMSTNPKTNPTVIPKSLIKRVSTTIDLTNNETEKVAKKKPIDLAIAVVAMYHIYDAAKSNTYNV